MLWSDRDFRFELLMELSVIIVNYNVKYFLEQCLCSVQKAITSCAIDAEVIVIDNHSQDNSVSYLMPFFPCVRFVVNDKNIGFTKACNQGYKLSSGKYVLFSDADLSTPLTELDRLLGAVVINVEQLSVEAADRFAGRIRYRGVQNNDRGVDVDQWIVISLCRSFKRNGQ